jgi:HEPN domain-containing protein
VTNDSLARSYLVKARVRLKILGVLQAEQAWSDVIRESQEVVELALKALLREVGVEPPKWHDVGGLLGSTMSGSRRRSTFTSVGSPRSAPGCARSASSRSTATST